MKGQAEHDATVREANPHDVRFKVKGGWDTSHHTGGYQAYCHTCGWTGGVTGRSEAHAEAKGHTDSMWSAEHIFIDGAWGPANTAGA